MTKLNFGRDINGFNAYAPSFSNVNFSATLAATTQQSLTVPSSSKSWVAVFSWSAGTDPWVAVNTNATSPVGSTFANTNSQLNPSSRTVNAGDIINIISKAGGDVGVSLYAIS